MENWLMLQNFYEGVMPMLKGHVDATTGGAFLSLTINDAMALIKKMVANQSSGEEHKQQKGMHTVKETDMLATKMDLLLKRLDEHASNKVTIMSGTISPPHKEVIRTSTQISIQINLP